MSSEEEGQAGVVCRLCWDFGEGSGKPVKGLNKEQCDQVCSGKDRTLQCGEWGRGARGVLRSPPHCLVLQTPSPPGSHPLLLVLVTVLL